MFLIAVTKKKLHIKPDNGKFEIVHVKIGPFFSAILTDGFLSQYFEDPNGFFIIESPLPDRPDIKDLIMSQVIFDKSKNILSIFSNTQTLRSIYYHLNPDGEFYSSTHISMLKKSGIKIEENTDVLPEFFTYQFVTPPKTIYKNINRLSFGGKLYIKITEKKCIIEQEQKFDPSSIESSISKKSDSIEKAIEQTYNGLLRSIKYLDPCRDRLAVLLSGGLDSSILFNICRNTFGINKSYSTSYPFEDIKADREKQYALSAAKAFGSDHYFYESNNNEFLSGFLDVMSIIEEPVVNERHIMLHLLCDKGIPQDKDIIISGRGADLTFGNGMLNYMYKLNRHKSIYQLFSLKPLLSMVKAASKITKRGNGFIDRIKFVHSIYRPLEDPKNILYSIYNWRNEDWVCKYLNVSKKDIIANRYELIKSFGNSSIYLKASIINYLYLGLTGIKLSEFNNKIRYFPFLDPDLLNNTYSIKWEDRIKQPKIILRGVAKYLNIPQFIIEREKSDFGVRLKNWSDKGGILDPLIALASKDFSKSLIAEFESSGTHRCCPTWIMLNYAIWKRLFIYDEPLDSLKNELLTNIKKHQHH